MRDAVDPSQRFIALDGCSNFRDLGGYPTGDGGVVATGRLYRSDRLAMLTRSDQAVLAGTLGLRTVIDLRRPAEVEPGAVEWLGGDIRYLNVSLNRPAGDDPPRIVDGSLAELYVWIAEGTRAAIRRVFETLARTPAYPAVFHCQGGKDRTGIIAALILAVAGVSDELIVTDYGLTQHHLDQVSEESLRAAFDLVDRKGLPRAVLEAREESMEGFLAQLRKSYGTIEAFLAGCGLDEETLLEVAERLVSRP